jgi:hypothetical protein
LGCSSHSDLVPRKERLQVGVVGVAFMDMVSTVTAILGRRRRQRRSIGREGDHSLLCRVVIVCASPAAPCRLVHQVSDWFAKGHQGGIYDMIDCVVRGIYP